MERYKPFDEITKDALNYACKENGVELSEKNEERLMNAYLELALFEEVESVLKELSEKKLVVFSNGSVNMIEPLVEQSSINEYIGEVISADEIKQYKPTPAAYNHALERLDVKRKRSCSCLPIHGILQAPKALDLIRPGSIVRSL